MKPVLVCAYHDPKQLLAYEYEQGVRTLKKAFSKICIACTPRTPAEKLRKLGIKVVLDKTDTRGDAYRLALKTGLGTRAARIFYCDFDRVLHWAASHPNELDRAAAAHGADCVWFERSPAAFKTHPAPQYYTEELANIMISRLLKTRRRDFISATLSISRRLAEVLLKKSKEEECGIYGEWPVLLYKNAAKTRFVRVEGLEWETPDYFPARSRRKIVEERNHSRKEWNVRTRIAVDFVRGAVHALRG